MIYLIGTGCGAGSMTKEAEEALREAVCLIGARRLLEMIPDDREKVTAVQPDAIRNAIKESQKKNPAGSICVLFSGDSGFYSGTRGLLPLLDGYEMRVLPGISSLQVLSARCGRPWQDWRLCSAHGLDCDAVREVCHGKPVFFLTGGKLGPADLCRQLAEAGLSELPVTVGQNLGTEEEQVVSGRAGEFAEKEFAPLSVMLADAAPRPVRRAPGLSDSMFERTEKVPMTK